MRYPFIKVYLKPIDTEIIKHVDLKKVQNLDDKYREVRLGAMEVNISE